MMLLAEVVLRQAAVAAAALLLKLLYNLFCGNSYTTLHAAGAAVTSASAIWKQEKQEQE